MSTASRRWYPTRVGRIGSIGPVVALALALALGAAVGPRQPVGAQTAVLPIGANVAVDTDALNLRSDLGLDGPVVAVMPSGTRATVLDGPYTADGLDWYYVDPAAYASGWAAGDFLILADEDTPPVPPIGFLSVGTETFVDTDALNLRNAADIRGSVVAVMPSGTPVVVIGEPFPASGYWWYYLDTPYGIGWAVADFLGFPSDTPTGFDVGDEVATTSGLNLRALPTLAGAVRAVLPAGTVGTVVGSPIGADGYVWYELATPYGTGWCVAAFLVLSAETDSEIIVPGGTAVVVDGPLNLRAGASLGAAIAGVLPAGAVVSVLDGPFVAEGYTWFEVRNAQQGTGWVAGEFMVAL